MNIIYKVLFVLILYLIPPFTISVFAANQDYDESLNLTDAEKLWLQEHPVVSFGPDPDYAPIEKIENNTLVGMNADYLAILSKKTGIKFKLTEEREWSRIFEKGKKKLIDFHTAIQITEDRKQYFNFTDSYIDLDTAIITQASSALGSELSIDDLEKKKVAVVKGYFWSEVLAKDYPNILQVEVASLAEGLTFVAFGKADAMFASYATTTHYIRKERITNLQVSGLTPYKIKYSMAVRNDWPELVSIFNKVLKSISAKQKKLIENRWIALTYHQPWYNKQLVKYLLIGLGVAVLLTLFGFFASYSLRRQVQVKTKELKHANEKLESLVRKRTLALEDANKDLELSHYSLQRANEKLTQLSYLDGVTQVYNRRYLDTALKEIIISEEYYGDPLTVIMVDIDDFKVYNDLYGHLKGDQVLYQVAQCLDQLTNRECETFARFGGEEFSYILPGVTLATAKIFAKKILARIKELQIEHSGSTVSKQLTVSIGFVTVSNDNSVSKNELLTMADEALYAAKREGRNRFVIYQDQ